MFEVNFFLVERDVELGFELVGDGARGDRAKHFSIVAGLDGHDGDQFGKAFGEFAHGVELVRFAISPALVQDFEAALVGTGQRNGQALRKQIIARVAGGDFDLVGLGAQANDVDGQDDFGFHAKRLKVEK